MKILKAKLDANRLTDECYVDITYRQWAQRRRIHLYFDPIMIVRIPLNKEYPEHKHNIQISIPHPFHKP